MRLVTDHLPAEAVAAMLNDTGVFFGDRHYAVAMTAFDDAGAVMAVAVGERKSPHDIHLSVVVRNPRAVSVRILRKLFAALFRDATRVTALIDPDNPEAIDRIRRMAFTYEGFLRLGLDGRRDACVYGMLKGECPWIGGHHMPRQIPLPLSVARH
jgi:hypothetical protein